MKEDIKWYLLMLCITIISVVAIWEYSNRTKVAMTNGYTLETLKGSMGVHWVKK